MADYRVRRKRTKKGMPVLGMVSALLCAALVVSFFNSSGSSAVQVDVQTTQNTGSGWGDASATPTSSSAGSATEPTVKIPQKNLSLSNCKNMAYATSEKLDALNDKLTAKTAAYENCVKAVEVKKEYVKHFHWKFLFSFDLPRDLTFEEIQQTTMDPMTALQEAKQVKEEMVALKMDLDQSVSDLYIEIYKARQSNEIDDERLYLANEKVAKIKAMVATGEKNEEDVKEAEQVVKDIESRILSTTRTHDANAKKLGKLIGLLDEYGNLSDPTLAGYKFAAPYRSDIIGKVDRKDLPWMQRYTLDHDSGIFESRGAKSLAYLNVTTVYSAIAGNVQWHDLMIIKPYYDAVIQGRTINKRDLKNANKEFLRAIDRYWDGYYKIGFWPLLFKFEKTMFKGKSDGTWYMQDSPDALFETILENYTANKENKNTESDKEMAVEDAFNVFIGLRNSLLTTQEQKATQYDKWQESKVEYRIGELGVNEYNAVLKAYEDLELQELDSLTTFSENVNSLNRITCGALDQLLGGGDLSNEFGEQLVVANDIPGASYYIVPKYDQLMFDLGVSVPEDFKYNISDFELWCDNTQIGTRTAVGSTIRHLMETTANVETVIIRLYDGQNFLADCQIDPGLLQGPLLIPEYNENEKIDNQVGTYELTTPEEGITCTIKLVPNTIENMGFFVLYDKNGKAIGGDTKRKVDEGIQYLAELKESLADVTIKCYDKDEQYLYDATFDIANSAVIKKVESAE